MNRWLANTPLELEQKASLCYLLTSCSSEFVEFLNRLFTPSSHIRTFQHLNLGIVVNAMEIEVTATLEKEILKGQLEDEKLKEITQNVVLGKAPRFRIDDNGTLWFGKRICVPEVKAICDMILREAHESAYSIHHDSTKMYLDLKEKYWWYGLKRDVAENVALCDTCQRVKDEH